MKKQVGEEEAQDIALAVDVHGLVRADRHGDLHIRIAINRSIIGLGNGRSTIGDARDQGVERVAFHRQVRQIIGSHARHACCTAHGKFGDHLHLPFHLVHVGEQPIFHEGLFGGSGSLGMGLGLFQDIGQSAKGLSSGGFKDVGKRYGHYGSLMVRRLVGGVSH